MLVAIYLPLVVTKPVYAQMMHSDQVGQSGVTKVYELDEDDKEDINDGELLFEKIKSGEVLCSSLSDTDFEKIGEYTFQKNVGDEHIHARMNAMMKERMGDEGERQMHVQLGKDQSGCIGRQRNTGILGMMRQIKYPLMGLIGLAIVLDSILLVLSLRKQKGI